LDEGLWSWAKYRSEVLGKVSVSEYLFMLVELDKERDLFKALSGSKDSEVDEDLDVEERLKKSIADSKKLLGK